MSKESHSFPVSVAEQIGVIEAIIFQHIVFLQRECGLDGWVKRSRQTLVSTYPYLTEKQVRGAIDRIEKMELVVSVVENSNKFDRTKSYQVTAKGLELMGISTLAKRANGNLQKGRSEGDERANAISYNSYNNSSSSFSEPPKIEILEPQKEIQKMESDQALEETFCLVRKIPRGRFKEYLNAFAVEIKGTGEKHFNAKDLKKHFLNWATIRHRIEEKPQQPAKSTDRPAKANIQHAGDPNKIKYEQESF